MQVADLFVMGRFFRQFRLLAGRAGLENQVTCARMVFTTQGIDAVTPGDFVLLTGHFLDSAELTFKEIVDRIRALGASGMGFRPDKNLPGIPAKIVGFYQWEPFPILEMGEDASCQRAMEDILYRVRGEESYRAYMEEEFDRALWGIQDNPHTLGQVLDLLEEYLRYPLELHWNDNYFACTEEDGVEIRDLDIPLREAVLRLGPEQLCLPVKTGTRCRNIFPVKSPEGDLAFLSVITPQGRAPSPLDISLTVKALPWLGVYLSSRIAEGRYLTRSSSALLVGAMQGAYRQSPELLQANAQCLNINTDCRRLLWAVEAPGAALSALEQLVEHTAPRLGAEWQMLRVGEQVFCLASLHRNPCPGEQELFAPCEEALEAARLPGLRVGVSRSFAGLVYLAEAYQEVRFLLRFRPPQKGVVYHCAPHIIYHMLDTCSDSEALRKIYKYTVTCLLDWDKANNTELFPTLQALVEHDFNTNRTAAALYLHRNTLYKRVDRALAMLHMDLANAEHRLSLQLIVRMHTLMHGEKEGLR